MRYVFDHEVSSRSRSDLTQEVAKLTTLVDDAWTAMEARLMAVETIVGLSQVEEPTEDTVTYWKDRALRA